MPYSLYRRGARASGRRRSSVGPATFVAASSAGNGQSTQIDPLLITIPAGAAVGNIAALFVTTNVNPTLTTPSGWNLRGSADAGTNARTWVFTRALIAGNPGSSVTLDFSANTKSVAQMICISGVTETGLQIANLPQTSATGTYTLPTLSSVPAGAMMIASFQRRRTGDGAANITTPSPYTEPGVYATTAYGSGTQNVYSGLGYAVTASGGTVGGEAGTTGVTSTGVNWLLTLPQG